jgi:hypothetical protein
LLGTILLTICWLTFLKLFAKDPGYISPIHLDRHSDLNLIEIRLQKNIHDNNIFNFDSLRKLFKPESQIQKISFENPKWNDNSDETVKFEINEINNLDNMMNGLRDVEQGSHSYIDKIKKVSQEFQVERELVSSVSL